MQDIRRSRGGTVLFLYAALMILADVADLFQENDWHLRQMALTVTIPVVTDSIVGLGLLMTCIIPLRHPPPRIFVAFLLLVSMVWKIYNVVVEFQHTRVFVWAMIPPILLVGFLAISIAMPITTKWSRATPFHEGQFQDIPSV